MRQTISNGRQGIVHPNCHGQANASQQQSFYWSPAVWTTLTFRVFLPNSRDRRIRSPLDLALLGGPPPRRGPGSGGGGAGGYGPARTQCGPHIWAAHRVNHTRSMRIPCRGVHRIGEPCRPQSCGDSCAKGEEHPLVRLGIGQVSWVSVPYHITSYHAILDGPTAPIVISRAVNASPGMVYPLGLSTTQGGCAQRGHTPQMGDHSYSQGSSPPVGCPQRRYMALVSHLVAGKSRLLYIADNAITPTASIIARYLGTN
jgi:hypothetical protein